MINTSHAQRWNVTGEGGTQPRVATRGKKQRKEKRRFHIHRRDVYLSRSLCAR